MLGEWAYWVLIGSTIDRECYLRYVEGALGRCNGLLVKPSLNGEEGFAHFMCRDSPDLVAQEIRNTVRKARELQQQSWLNTTEKSPMNEYSCPISLSEIHHGPFRNRPRCKKFKKKEMINGNRLNRPLE